MQKLTIIRATANDVDEMYELLMQHGPNQWNYLPEDGVAAELENVVDGKAIALLAELDSHIIGFAVTYPGYMRFPEHMHSDVVVEKVGYIGNVVVHKDYAGKGIGTILLEQAKVALLERGVSEVHIDCHEENLASRGMMKKAGFVKLALYSDPKRRSSGSRKSWVGRFTPSGSA